MLGQPASDRAAGQRRRLIDHLSRLDWPNPQPSCTVLQAVNTTAEPPLGAGRLACEVTDSSSEMVVRMGLALDLTG